MRLGRPPIRYSPEYEAERNRAIEASSRASHQRGRDILVDPGRLIVLGESDGERWEIYVDSPSGTVRARKI